MLKLTLRRIGAVVLALTIAAILAITLWPTHVDQGHEGTVRHVVTVLHSEKVAPAWYGYSEVEFTANILMFVPLGLLLGLLVPRRRIAWVALAIPGFSAAIETTQGLFLPGRTASIFDVLSNTTGGWLGLALASVIVAVVASIRSRNVIVNSPVT